MTLQRLQKVCPIHLPFEKTTRMKTLAIRDFFHGIFILRAMHASPCQYYNDDLYFATRLPIIAVISLISIPVFLDVTCYDFIVNAFREHKCNLRWWKLCNTQIQIWCCTGQSPRHSSPSLTQ